MPRIACSSKSETSPRRPTLTHQFALSRRQAYRRAGRRAECTGPGGRAVGGGELPVRTVRTLRAASGLTLGQIVTQALAASCAPGLAVARRAAPGARQIQLDGVFDRLRSRKLAQAYEFLVPTQTRPLETVVKEPQRRRNSNASSARESDGGVDRVRDDPIWRCRRRRRV